MNCQRHDLEAVGVCAYCGRAVCRQCANVSGAARLTCQETCAAALARNDRALEFLLEKSLQSARANSVYYYLCGILCAGATIAASFWLPVPFLMWFLGSTAVALIISGVWFGRVARKMKP
ncbi:MAG TPA: hypothetical protein VMR33_11050 [Candidatus Baltobacteraceae bacterium]|jgi:hypothetical protein|nr:hypothetical protein [Candidatus Baltobacteraceae bacterium]